MDALKFSRAAESDLRWYNRCVEAISEIDQHIMARTKASAAAPTGPAPLWPPAVPFTLEYRQSRYYAGDYLRGRCPKCHESPKPKYHKDKADCFEQSTLYRNTHPEKSKELGEHLHYYCACGYSWTGPTLDEGRT